MDGEQLDLTYIPLRYVIQDISTIAEFDNGFTETTTHLLQLCLVQVGHDNVLIRCPFHDPFERVHLRFVMPYRWLTLNILEPGSYLDQRRAAHDRRFRANILIKDASFDVRVNFPNGMG